ncbi:putative damage-inducible protein DinB [Nocardiopsis mwathae]|uniref:Putative damage-inducible protein DinB n=1 Tax=Nocardiopsis mwathae TaxID=1472723 RepID=A0A7X0D5L9_9ACTN|nr:DinB family protein [Nocardiopsis mwathae]MBB6172398.1 putative damage-inducible protein DinB [Nocardiopsis mwathae]
MTNTTARFDPPKSADERTMLTSHLDWHRATVRMKCAGLDPALASAAPLPTSPLMTIGGVVSHLRWVEHHWFEVRLLGARDRAPWSPADWDAEFRVGARRPLAELLDEYDAQCARSREITAKLELNSGARTAGEGERPATLRWVLTHMTGETARHNGQLDLLRELADGSTGF